MLKEVQKTEQKSDQKKVKEEKNREEVKAPSRRSARNVGKDTNYNIDEILDAADALKNVSCGGGGINLMLA